MRLVFPNNESDQVELKPGDNAIGSSDDADIVLKVNGIAENHAVINVSAWSSRMVFVKLTPARSLN